MHSSERTAARAAALDLHASLAGLRHYVAMDNNDYDLRWYLLYHLAPFWFDERRLAPMALRAALDPLAASRRPLRWGAGWKPSASQGLVETVEEIERVVTTYGASEVLALIDRVAGPIPEEQRGFYNRPFAIGQAVWQLRFRYKGNDEPVELEDGQVMRGSRAGCLFLDHPGLTVYDALAELKSGFIDALGFMDSSTTRLYLHQAVDFDYARARAEVVREFALLEERRRKEEARPGADKILSADSKADKTEKKAVPYPRNPEVVTLAKLVKKGLAKGFTKIKVARDFTEGNEKKAKSLLRVIRRFPHLLT